MATSDTEYYRHREAEELARARSAQDPKAALAHSSLAQLYRNRTADAGTGKTA